MEDDVVIVRVESYEDSNYATHDRLLVNGKELFRVHPLCECPEDAIIGRDLISSDEIASFLKRFLNENKGKKVKFEYADVEGF